MKNKRLPTKTLPPFEGYYMNLAGAAHARANCLGKKIGAVIIVGNRVVSTGYNGVPEGMTNCLNGGCYTCFNKYQKRKTNGPAKDRRKSGKGYDECICVHAEQNALMSAARFGIALENGEIFSTVQPCFTCLKQILQVKIKRVFFKKQLYKKDHDPRLRKAYSLLQNHLQEGMWQVTDSCVKKKFTFKQT